MINHPAKPTNNNSECTDRKIVVLKTANPAAIIDDGPRENSHPTAISVETAEIAPKQSGSVG